MEVASLNVMVSVLSRLLRVLLCRGCGALKLLTASSWQHLNKPIKLAVGKVLTQPGVARVEPTSCNFLPLCSGGQAEFTAVLLGLLDCVEPEWP